MSVILIRRATTQPTPPPIAMATRISGSAPRCSSSVVMTAIAMPIMPKRLPRWLVSGDDSPRSARMNSTPETR